MIILFVICKRFADKIKTKIAKIQLLLLLVNSYFNRFSNHATKQLWIVIAPLNKEILSFRISKERNMFVAEHFLSDTVKEYDRHPISTDGGTWYPQSCKFLKLKHHLHS